VWLRTSIHSTEQKIVVVLLKPTHNFKTLDTLFASWYMMNGGDLYELARILGHSKNIKMTERYAKLARQLSPGPAARRARRGSY